MVLDINGTSVLTNEKGEFQVTLQDTGYYSILSGLPDDLGRQAIELLRTYVDSGLNWSIRSPLVIEMVRNVSIAGDVCVRTIGGTRYAEFPYLNSTDVPIQLPKSYTSLNRLVPSNANSSLIELFLKGRNTFRVPLEEFLSGNSDSYGGGWIIAGQVASFNFNKTALPPCTDSGDPEPTPGPQPTPTPTPTPAPGDLCPPTDMGSFERLFKFSSRVVINQVSTGKTLLSRARRVTPTLRGFLFKRGGEALADLRAATERYKGARSCPAAQSMSGSCRQVSVNKDEFNAIFSELYAGTPNVFKSLDKKATAQKRAFDLLVDQLPDEVVLCD